MKILLLIFCVLFFVPAKSQSHVTTWNFDHGMAFAGNRPGLLFGVSKRVSTFGCVGMSYGRTYINAVWYYDYLTEVYAGTEVRLIQLPGWILRRRRRGGGFGWNNFYLIASINGGGALGKRKELLAFPEVSLMYIYSTKPLLKLSYAYHLSFGTGEMSEGFHHRIKLMISTAFLKQVHRFW